MTMKVPNENEKREKRERIYHMELLFEISSKFECIEWNFPESNKAKMKWIDTKI